jgi:hypothetical protein
MSCRYTQRDQHRDKELTIKAILAGMGQAIDLGATLMPPFSLLDPPEALPARGRAALRADAKRIRSDMRRAVRVIKHAS